MRTEYKVVPAPERARKKRGLKGPALFAHEMETVMNELAADGWIYLRADTLPHEERSGLTNKTTTYRNLLVFQRLVQEDVAQTLPEPAAVADPVPPPAPTPEPEPQGRQDTDEVVSNLWETLEVEEENPEASGPNRQR